MTWLDAAIGWISPSAGLARARARAALHAVRAYEGAATTRRTSNWKTSGASANAEVASGLSRLRNRSRDLVRNNPYARRSVAALVGNAIGTGIELGVDNAQVRKVWGQWVREADFFGKCDLNGLQALAARANFESGDCLVLRVRTGNADAGVSGVPLKLKVVEGDLLDAMVNGPLKNGGTAVNGVEMDADGRVVAYHILPAHPGETALQPPRVKSARWPAEDVIHLFEKERPGQVLGVPRLAASIMRVRDLDDYQEALLVKKKIEACFAAFVSTDDDSRVVGTSTTTETDSDGNSRRVERLSPGQIMYGKVGESITFGQPSSSTDAGFTSDTLHAIAAGIGCTYEQLTGDLARVNYSSMRGGRAEFKILIEQYRWLTFVPQVLERVYGWFEEAAAQAGKIRTRNYEHTWTAPRWEYVNPAEDVKADKEELAAGLASLSEKLRARGESPDAVLKEIAEEREKLARLGIQVDYTAKASAAKTAGGGDDEGDAGNVNGDAKGDERQLSLEFARHAAEAIAANSAGMAAVADAIREAPAPQFSMSSPAVNVALQMPESIERLVDEARQVGASIAASNETQSKILAGLTAVAERQEVTNQALVTEATRVESGISDLARIARAPRIPEYDADGNLIAARIGHEME